MTDKVRLQFEISAKTLAEVERLMIETGVSTRKDFFNNALSLLEWAIRERKAGRTIASVDESNQTFRELIMPILSHIE